MIEPIPAIDLIDGKCVRLQKGDFTTKTIYSADPVDMAKQFNDYGFRRLHLVDLDGAGSGRVKHLKILEKIAGKTDLEIDFGGGVKDLRDVIDIFNAGSSLVCIGSMVVKNRAEFFKVLEKYGPDKIIVAADTRDDKLVISGWKEKLDVSLYDFIDEITEKGVTGILCTDVNKDGMLSGTSIDLYQSLSEKFPGLYIIASGGVSNIKDIEILDSSNIPAVVFGKAFYEGKLSVNELKPYLEYRK